MSQHLFLRNRLYNAAIMAGRRPTKDAPVFGKRLAAIRKAQGLSQQQLADLLGATRSNIDYYERRATNPTTDFVQRCTDILKINVTDLIGDEPAEKETRKRGPKSALERSFEQISKLPHSKQKEILKVVDALVAQG